MPNLNRYVTYACGFVDFEGKEEKDVPNLMEDFIRFCDSYNQITKYYLMAHTETDCLHIHFIFYSSKNVCLMTYFNKLRSWFIEKKKLVRDDQGISIAKCESINGHLRYLTHTDKASVDAHKKQYSIDDFVSNDEIENIDTMIHSRKGTIDAYMLRDAVLDCPHEFDLMVRLGLPIYHRYRYEIQTIRENRVFLEEQRRIEKAERHKDDDLPF